MTTAKYFTVLYQTPAGKYGIVPDAPLLVYRDQLSAGQGEWQVELPRTWTSAGIPGDLRGSDDLVLALAGGTKWYVYVNDDVTINRAGGTIWGDFTWGSSTWGDPGPGLGILQWQGEIEEITPIVGQTDEKISLLLLPPAKAAADGIFMGIKSFTNIDAVEAIHYFFNQGLMPTLQWDPRNQLSGNLITQTFEYQTFRSIMEFCTTAAGPNWVNHIDERSRFRIWKPDITKPPTHVWRLGRDVHHVDYTTTRIIQKNRVTVRGKSGIFSTVQDVNWTQANTHDVVFNFPEVTDLATLQILGNSLLVAYNKIFNRARITVFSDAGNVPAGFTGAVFYGHYLEDIRPGDTARLWIDETDKSQFVWGDGAWGTMRWFSSITGISPLPQIIQAVTYTGGDRVDIDLSTQRPHIVAAHRRVQRLAEQALAQQVQ